MQFRVHYRPINCKAYSNDFHLDANDLPHAITKIQKHFTNNPDRILTDVIDLQTGESVLTEVVCTMADADKIFEGREMFSPMF